MSNPDISGKGLVLPPSAGTAPLPKGGYAVTIDGTDESGHLRCVYPGGFVKHHGAATVEELGQKVVAVLRGRYGAEAVAFAKVPKSLDAGQAFEVKGCDYRKVDADGRPVAGG